MMRRARRIAAAATLLLLAVLVQVWGQEGADPMIGAALAISELTHNGDGVYRVVCRLIISNPGTVDLSEVHAQLDLSEIFPGDTAVRVLSLESFQVAVHPSYDGKEQTEVLLGSDALPPGETASVKLTLEVLPTGPGSVDAAFDVQAVAPNGETIEDRSQFGADPDPDGNGNPTDNNDPTPISFREGPQLGLALELRTQSENTDGSYDVAYEIVIANYGDVVLRELQIDPSLDSAFGDKADFEIVSISSESLTPRLDFDGIEVTELLEGSDSLGLDGQAEISLVVRIHPLAELPRFEDRVFGSGITPLGTQVADLSQRGSDPDPDEDGIPGNNSQASRVILALLSIGGQMNLTVSASETSDLAIDGMELAVFASLQDYAVQLAADLSDTGLSALSIGASGPLGPVELSSALAFDAANLAFESWQAGAAVDFFGIDVVDLMTLSVPQTTSVNQLTLSAAANGISFQGTIKHGICPIEFQAVNLCGSWDWTGCDVSMSGCLLFTGEGFDSFSVSLSGYTLFEGVFGASGTLDASLIYQVDEKTLSPTLSVEPDWIICPEISLFGEVIVTASPLGIDGISIYGIAVEAPVGPVVFELKDSFTDAKNSTVTGKSEYFEVIGVSGPIASCCGSPGSFSVQTFFERGPNPPSGGLFGIGLLTGSLQVQLFDGFGFSITAEYRPVSPTWSVVFESSVVW